MIPVYGITVQEHAADSSNPHGAKMKITEKLNVGTNDEYTSGYALKVQGGATIDNLNLGGGNLTFGTASSLYGSLSIGTTTAGTSRINVIGTVTATTFVGDGTFLTGIGAGTGTGNWTDTGSATQTYYPDTYTRKVAVGTTTTNSNQFAVDGNARVYGTLTATKFVGDGSLLTGISTETIWVNSGSTTSQGTVTQNIVLGSTTAAANQKLTVVGSSTFRDTYIGGNLSLGTAGSTLIGGTPTVKLAIGDNDTGLRYISDGVYALVGNGDDQLIVDGDNDRIYIGTSTGDSKLYVKGDIKATGTITAAYFSGAETIWVNNGSTTHQGTVTQNVVLGSTTAASGQKFTVVGSSTVRDLYVGGFLAIGTGGSSLIGGTPTIKVAIGDNDTGFRHISDGVYALVANSDDQIVIDGNNDRVYIGTSTGDTKLYVKDDIKATGTITAAYFSGNGASLTGISDPKWTDTGEALRPGTVTYKVRIGTTTPDGADLQVSGTASFTGTTSINILIANVPDATDQDDPIAGGQLSYMKAELLSEIYNHSLSVTDVHGFGSETISPASVKEQYGIIGNKSYGSSTTPSTFYLTCDSIKFIDENKSSLVFTGDIVANTITTAGPAAGGRDQAAAFGANDWIYFYYIADGLGTISSVSSLSYPNPVALPGSYTHWCLAGIVKSSSGSLKTGYMGGNTFYYEARQTVATSQTNTTESTIDLSSYIPPQAMEWTGELELGIINSVPSSTQARYNLRLATSVNYCRPLVNTGAPGLANWQSQFVIVPNTNQSIITIWTDAVGNTVSGNIYLNSYSIPAGGL
jgi:hypothetical protein